MVEQNKNMESDPIREKSSVFGSLMVQCLRLLEKDRKETEKKEEYPFEADKDASGRLLRPYAFLVHRAEYLLPKYNISGRTIRNTVKGIFFAGLGLILLFGIFLLPLAKAANILGTDEVNLAGPFFWFVALQLFFLCLSFFFLILSGIQFVFLFLFFRNRTKTSGQASWLDRCSSLAGTGIIGLIRFFYSARENSNRSENDQKIIPSFVDYLVHKREPIFCLSGLYSHFFWLILSFFLLLCLMIQMQGNEYRYRWKTSLSSIDETRQLTVFLSKPFPHFAKPTEDDIQSLFEKKVGTEKGEGAHQSQIRRHWSWFVLFSVLFYSVFPRGLLALIYYGLFRRSLREFDPDLGDPYFKKIIEEEEKNDGEIRTEKIIEESDQLPSPLDLSKTEDPMDSVPMELTKTDLKNISDMSDVSCSVCSSDLVVALGYDADMNYEIWQQILDKNGEKEIFGNIVANRETKRNFLDQFQKIGQRIRACVLLTDCSFPPARQFLLFLEELIKSAPQSEFFIILSCGERLRQKFHGDPVSIRERISDWEQRIQKIRHQLNVRVEAITCFDHELNLPGPREQIAAIVQQRAAQSSGNDQNKMDQAFLSIRKECEKIFEESRSEDYSKTDHEDYDRELRLYQTIQKIYRTESESFLSRCRDYISQKTSIDPDALNRLQEQIPEIRDLEELKTKILPSAEMYEKVKGFCSKLSPRCAIAVGLTGAALPLAAAAAPLIGGTITLASVAGLVGSLGTILPASLAAGGTGALIGSMIPASFSMVKDRVKKELTDIFSGQIYEDNQKNGSLDCIPLINTLVCTGTVWTLIFELQGRSEEIIADLLPKILAPIEESLLDTMEEVNRVLEKIRANREDLDLIESKNNE